MAAMEQREFHHLCLVLCLFLAHVAFHLVLLDPVVVEHVHDVEETAFSCEEISDVWRHSIDLHCPSMVPHSSSLSTPCTSAL